MANPHPHLQPQPKPHHTHTQTIQQAEDWCFVCKDGGDLLLCDYQNCSKVYHHECVGIDEEGTSDIDEHWNCDCHSCSICKGSSEVYCFCCPESFCTRCIKLVKFAQFLGDKGLCSECWDIFLLAEKYTPNKKRVDFKDRDTYECLWKEYWEIIKERENLSRKHLEAARARLDERKRVNKDRNSVTDDMIRSNVVLTSSEDNDSSSVEYIKTRKKMKKTNQSRAFNFLELGSKPLVQFLSSIGMEKTEELSHGDVSSIILNYIKERDLIHPVKKEKFLCDKKLRTVFQKKIVSMKEIDLLLESHFSGQKGNRKRCLDSEQSGEDTDDTDELSSGKIKQQKTNMAVKLKPEKKKGCYASIVTDNIKLVYLRRSLIEDLLIKHPESFEDKVVGSFVKVIMTDSMEYCHKGRTSHQLFRVIGLKKTSNTDEINGRNLLLSVCTLDDVQISKLSDSEVTEEDCEDLKEKIAKGLLKKPTVEEIEKQAQILHQIIKKNWIETELVNLQHRIDRANEKGRRNELYVLLQRREKLKKQPEQERLMKQTPNIIADDDDDGDGDGDDDDADCVAVEPLLTSAGGRTTMATANKVIYF